MTPAPTEEPVSSGTEQVQASPSAGVMFDESNGTVTVKAVSMENADYLRIHRSDTEWKSGWRGLAEVGDTATFTDLEDGTTLTVVGVVDERQAVLQTYEVG